MTNLEHRAPYDPAAAIPSRPELLPDDREALLALAGDRVSSAGARVGSPEGAGA